MLNEVNYLASPRRVAPPDLLPQVENLLHNATGPRGHPSGSSDEAAHDHLSSGGRRVRARLALDACRNLAICEVDSVILAACVELIHNASLIHDDVIDQSEWRRGRKTILSTHGSEVAVCTGDLLLSAAYGVLAGFNEVKKLPKILTIIHRSIALAIHGQCAERLPVVMGDALWDSYDHVVVAKSGALLLLPLELALTMGDHEEHIPKARRAVCAFAIAYQIADDLQDLSLDRGDHAHPPAFNSVLMLEAAGHHGDAEIIAGSYAKERLSEAIQAASELPSGSGELLVRLAREMLNTSWPKPL